MKIPNNIVEEYWIKFCSKSDLVYENRKHNSFSFGGSTDKLAKWVKNGNKKASSSLYDSYLYEREELPQTGLCSIVLDSNGTPTCIIEIEKVLILKFSEVTEELAKMENMETGDLYSWKQFHWDFFSEQGRMIGIEFKNDSRIVIEQFSVIYKDEES